MAEIVGVVAAATQLATTCLSLIEFTKRIKGSSSSLREYESQLWEIKLLSESISKNKLLQTPEVEAHTLSILTLVNDNDLAPLIKKRRFLRTCVFLYKSSDLSEAFVNLERRKANLSLVLHNLQAEAIHQIRSDVNAMARPEQSDSDSSYGSQCDPSEMRLSSPLPVGDAKGDRLEPRPERDGALPLAGLDASTGDGQADNEIKPPRLTFQRFMELESMAKAIQEQRPGSTMFLNNTADGNATQSMGKDIFVGDGAEAPRGQEANKPPDTYYGCKATNGAEQVLGDKERFPTFAAKKAYGSQTVIIADCEALSGPVSKSGRDKSCTSQRCGPTTWVGNVKGTSDQ